MQFKPGTIAVLFLLAIATAACRKKNTEPIIKIIPRHHSTLIDSCVVYIKYGTNDMPADSVYDDSVKVIVSPEDNIPYATFKGLGMSKYYLYGRGWDKTRDVEVLGGAPLTIDAMETKTIYLAISDGD